jgi:hypothetical protein
MNRLEVIFYSVSTIFQVAAMVFTALMIYAKGDRRPWVMLFIAMAVMLLQRLVAIVRGGGPPTADYVFFSSILSIAVSLLLFLALFFVRQLSRSEQQSAEMALRRSAERDDARARLSAAMQAAEVMIGRACARRWRPRWRAMRRPTRRNIASPSRMVPGAGSARAAASTATLSVRPSA